MSVELTRVIKVAEELSGALEAATSLTVISTDGLVLSTEAQDKRKRCLKTIGVIGGLLFSIGSFVVVLVSYLEPTVGEVIVNGVTNSTWQK